MKSFNKFLTALLIATLYIFVINSNKVFAQTSTTTSDTTKPQDQKTVEISQIVTDLDAQRIKKLEDEILLSLPGETDNPNHVIAFTDPSGKGVFLDIDGQGYSQISNPFTLPSLGIGTHTLSFKFTDKEGAQQILERSLAVIPRVPILNPPDSSANNKIVFSGTALTNATVELFITNGTKSYKAQVSVADVGSWEYTLAESLDKGVYTVIATARKNGLASTFSEPQTFELADKIVVKQTDQNKSKILFSFDLITQKNIGDVVKNNPHLLYLLVGILIIGLLIGLIISSFKQSGKNKKAERLFKTLIDKNSSNNDKKTSTTAKTDPNVNGKSLTLREKFEISGIKVDRIDTPTSILIKPNEKDETKDKDLLKLKKKTENRQRSFLGIRFGRNKKSEENDKKPSIKNKMNDKVSSREKREIPEALKEVEKKEITQKEVIVKKEDFLKDFESYNPDKKEEVSNSIVPEDKNDEIKVKKNKKDDKGSIKITLTSK